MSTGVPGLDVVLGGGLPEYSFNLIAGPPGSGKTTLVHHILFETASAKRPAIYFTVLGEPSLKMLRHQQQMAYFDADKVGTVIRYVDLSADVLRGDFDALLATIIKHVETTNPSIIVVDSFRTMSGLQATAGEAAARGFMQRLAMNLTSWQVTSFLLGEYSQREMEDGRSPIFTIADAILCVTRDKQRNSVVRKLEVMKSRGMAAIPGLHTFRITTKGIHVFSRMTAPIDDEEQQLSEERAAVGIPGLDALLGGGLPVGDLTIVAGPSGTGKTAFCTHFVAEGARLGEPAVLAVFEEKPKDYLARARKMGFDLDELVRTNQLRVIYLRPLDLGPDEILYQVQQAVAEIGARRVVLDSLNGLELSLAPTFRDDFQESLYRLVGWLSGGGISIVLTVEVMETFTDIKFSTHAVSFLAQNIIFLRYIEIEGRLEKVLAIVKMRRSEHSTGLHRYRISGNGIEVAPESLATYVGIVTGVPVPSDGPALRSKPGRGVPTAARRTVAQGKRTRRKGRS
jgi:circadian clock protein KaiC